MPEWLGHGAAAAAAAAAAAQQQQSRTRIQHSSIGGIVNLSQSSAARRPPPLERYRIEEAHRARRHAAVLHPSTCRVRSPSLNSVNTEYLTVAPHRSPCAATRIGNEIMGDSMMIKYEIM